MDQSLVITAIGTDRPGIVNELTEILLDAKLNIEDSRMSLLGGEFAMILLVSGEPQACDSLQQQIANLQSRLDLQLIAKPTQSAQKTDHQRFAISVEGMDNPGIVHRLARYLSLHKINIVNMQTQASHAPHTGTPMFSVEMLVDIPPEQNTQDIQSDFSQLCDELNMDVQFNQA